MKWFPQLMPDILAFIRSIFNPRVFAVSAFIVLIEFPEYETDFTFIRFPNSFKINKFAIHNNLIECLSFKLLVSAARASGVSLAFIKRLHNTR